MFFKRDSLTLWRAEEIRDGRSEKAFSLFSSECFPVCVQESIPHMAAVYGFQYELVQYKWPRWLHQQTEKQRLIWGYKILFLDVLFPLAVDKIIFVDADQVRSPS